ncbi:MAG: hypothetical protein ACLUR5_04520 [Eubacterium ventriosum]
MENGIITIDRQMQYQEGLIKLVSLKTRNAKRKIYMCSKLKKYFENLVLTEKVQERIKSAKATESNFYTQILKGI